MRIETTDLVDTEDVALLIGLKNQNGVSVYRSRYDDFPAPIYKKGRVVLWVRPDIVAWAKKHERKPL